MALLKKIIIIIIKKSNKIERSGARAGKKTTTFKLSQVITFQSSRIICAP